jgi:chromosome segregation ATPase
MERTRAAFSQSKAALQAHETKAQADVDALRAQIAATRDAASEHATSLYRVDLQVTQIKNATSALQADSGTLKSDVATLQANLGPTQTTVDSVQIDVGALQTTVGNIQTSVRTLLAHVDTIQTDVSTLRTETAALQAEFVVTKSEVNILQADAVVIQSELGEHQTVLGRLELNIQQRRGRRAPRVTGRSQDSREPAA